MHWCRHHWYHLLCKMGRGRRPNMALEPTRALQTQRAFRQRKAEHLAGLQDSIDQLTEENNRFRQLLNLEPRVELERNSRERSSSSRPTSDTAPASGEEDSLSTAEVKQQLALAATQVEQQISELYRSLRVLRSVIDSNSTSKDLLNRASIVARSISIDEDQRHVPKKPRQTYEQSHEERTGNAYALSLPGSEHPASTVNGVSMTSDLLPHNKLDYREASSIRHLPHLQTYPHNSMDVDTRRPPLSQTASTPRTMSYRSTTASPALSATSVRSAQAADSRQYTHSASRMPLSPVDFPSHASLRHQASSSPHHQVKSEPVYPHMQHLARHPQRTDQIVTQLDLFPAATGEATSFPATRSLAMQALKSSQDRQKYSLDECAAGPSAPMPLPANESISIRADKGCCPTKSATSAAVTDPSPPLGISIDMKTQTPNGEPCCFGLVECDDQGRIII